MQGKTLRQKFLAFFASQKHAILESASLLPENDPTCLFTTAGMHPLVPFLLGEKHPAGQRLASCQQCVRTVDIERVGDSTHLTFFEMLGNWSLGDYTRAEAAKLALTFLTQDLGLRPEKLAVSVFAGDADAPFDAASFHIWQQLGIPAERIARLDKAENWWGPAGQTGPCGPDSEIFYWQAETPPPPNFEPKNENWVEIWNLVFMEFEKTATGEFLPLAQKNIDTGLGLERLAAILQNAKTVFGTDLFQPILTSIKDLAQTQDERRERIIADHLRAAVQILASGVQPSNLEAGYVLRRLLRRAIRYARQIGITEAFCVEIAKTVFAVFPKLEPQAAKIFTELKKEERQFQKTLARGEKALENFLAKNPTLNGQEAFYFYETFGFPLELTQEFLREKNLQLKNPAQFTKALNQHQERSRVGAQQKFAGGLADNSAMTTRLHTATHLLQAGLQKILGPEIRQRGSNITAERLRFDFNFPRKLTAAEIAAVEQFVNTAIKQDLPVTWEELSLEEAKQAGALGVFEHKYGERVKVYSVADVSKELCGGPHAKRTGALGKFKIKKEESSSAGVRRIKGILVAAA